MMKNLLKVWIMSFISKVDFQNNQMRTLKDQQALLMMMFENNTEQEQEMIKAN